MWTLGPLRDLFRHMEWADEEVWRATAPLSASPVDERLRDLLLHIHVVQRAFLHVWTARPLTFPEPRQFPALLDVHAWAQPYYAEVEEFLETLDPARLDEPIVMPWVRHLEKLRGRECERPSLAETMFQITSHSTYHRGQVNARLRELGAEPPLVDYIAWLWFDRPSHNKTAAAPV